jgi:hypothetical protein
MALLRANSRSLVGQSAASLGMTNLKDCGAEGSVTRLTGNSGEQSVW